MATLLVVNPNTSDAVTALLRDHAERGAPPGGIVHARTAAFGARYIVDEPTVAVAAEATLDAWDAHRAAHGAPDAVLIGCFGDPALLALRARAGVPVHALAEASMHAAAARGRYAIVTGGAGWPPLLRRLAAALALDAELAGIVAVERSGAELAADPAAGERLLLAACRDALAAHPEVATLVLGGAALAPFAPALATQLPVPLIDSVACGVAAAWAAAG